MKMGTRERFYDSVYSQHVATGCYTRALYLFVPGAQKAVVWATHLSRWTDNVHVMRSEFE